MKSLIRSITGAALISTALAGPFPPAAGSVGSDAIISTDPRFSFWATAAVVTRGPWDIDPAFIENSYLASFGRDSAATGPPDATLNYVYIPNSGLGPVVSLGDGGNASLTFNSPIGDVPGPDFAVFENSFTNFFLELAHVEVSSDGINFYRFPSTSLTTFAPDPEDQTSANPTDIRNLAGKYVAGYGTPFDLAELRILYPTLDIQRITHVRVVDVIGTSDPLYGSRDFAGRIVADPYPTLYSTGGFDLDAVGAFTATTTTYAAWAASQLLTGGDQGAAADPDHNGVPNLIEYLCGNGSVSISDGASTKTLRFSRLSYRTGGNLKVQGSANLSDWTTLATSENAATMVSANGAVASVSETGTFRMEVSVQVPVGSIYRFFRLASELVP